MRAVPGAILCVVLLFLPAAAGGSVRYAAPGGSGGEPCGPAMPCSIEQAINKAASGDEVVLAPGTYTVAPGASLAPAKGVTGFYVHGDPAAGPPPDVRGTAPAALLSLRPLGRAAYLEVTNEETESRALECEAGGEVDRVTAAIVGNLDVALWLVDDCAVRDSVIRASGGQALAILGLGGSSTAVLTNDTVIAEGTGSTAVQSGSLASQDVHRVALVNTIARAQTDLHPSPGEDQIGEIAAQNSNFSTVAANAGSSFVDLGGNQHEAPLFVNAVAGDYHEAAGSPTIDAGIASGLGPFDLDGNPRVLGPAPDIGAYETAGPARPAGGGGGPSSPTPAPAELLSLSLEPKVFKPRFTGGPFAPKILKSRPPVGALVTYELSGPATVQFSVSRKVQGHRVGAICKRGRPTAGARACPVFVPVKGSFTVQGSSGSNSFAFSGRVGGRTLKPGPYRLNGVVGATVKRTTFKIFG